MSGEHAQRTIAPADLRGATRQTGVAAGLLVGQATRYSAPWAVAWSDGGTQAARNGGLTFINSADPHDEEYLCGAVARRTTIVYGE